MNDWRLIEQNMKVDLAVDVREHAKAIKAPTLSITGKHDQIVPPFYTQELADLKLRVSESALARMRSYEGKKITSPSRGFEV